MVGNIFGISFSSLCSLANLLFHTLMHSTATTLSIFLLVFVFFSFIGFLSVIKKKSLISVIMFLWILLSLASLIYFRHTYSSAPNGDFRYILPVLIPFLYFVTSGIFFFEKRFPIITWIGVFSIIIFCAGSFLFFLLPLFG